MSKAKALDLNWYSFDKILSYNAVWMFIVGSRGEGKTYGAIKRSINAAIKRGEEFVYLRRHEKELKAAIPSFFEAIELHEEFPDYDFRIVGKSGQMSPVAQRDQKGRKWVTIVHFVALSTAQSMKSVNYARVTTIIFDEFIKEKGYSQYIPGEYAAMTNFFITVDRNKEKTKLFFLANSVSIINPYFTELEINPDLLPEYSMHGPRLYDENGNSAGKFVVVHVSNNQEFKEAVGQTKLAQFLSGSKFYDFAIGNTFNDAHQELVRKKTPGAKYRYTLETSKGTFAVWRDFDLDLYFLQTKRPGSGGEVMLTMISENMTGEKRLVSRNNPLLGGLRTAFVHGQAYFDRASTRIAFAEIFKQ